MPNLFFLVPGYGEALSLFLYSKSGDFNMEQFVD